MGDTYTLIEGLTEDQSKAVAVLQQYQKTKYFSGISIGILIEDFKVVNTLKNTNPVKADANEKAPFALRGDDPSNSP